MELRPYQKKAVSRAIRNLLSVDRLALVMPAGSGKTLVASRICKVFEPVLWIAHQRELLSQAEKALRDAKVDFDLLSSAANVVPSHWDGLLVVDEFHHEACETYVNLLARFEYNKILGITATPYRLDRTRLRFDRRIDVVGQRDLIEQGYLAPVRLFRVRVPPAKPGMGTIAQSLVDWANIHYGYIGKTIFFTNSLLEAEYISKNLKISNEIISGNTDRELQLEKFRSQNGMQCLISCLILTEGVDLPMCKTAILGRQTRSQTLLSQMIGRPMRIFPGKKYCNIVEAAPIFGGGNYARTETIIDPDEKYISTFNGISGCKTRKA